jgi:hypothetical protein
MSRISASRISLLLTGPIPVALIALQGAVTIALEGGGRGSHTHHLFLLLVLAENVTALCWRRRHPVLALAGVMLTFVLVDSWPTTLPAVLLALVTVFLTAPRRSALIVGLVTASLIVATPVVHGDLGAGAQPRPPHSLPASRTSQNSGYQAGQARTRVAMCPLKQRLGSARDLIGVAEGCGT